MESVSSSKISLRPMENIRKDTQVEIDDIKSEDDYDSENNHSFRDENYDLKMVIEYFDGE